MVSVGFVGHEARFEIDVVLSMVINQKSSFCFFYAMVFLSLWGATKYLVTFSYPK